MFLPLVERAKTILGIATDGKGSLRRKYGEKHGEPVLPCRRSSRKCGILDAGLYWINSLVICGLSRLPG
jgi:hypothetical protein